MHPSPLSRSCLLLVATVGSWGCRAPDLEDTSAATGTGGESAGTDGEDDTGGGQTGGTGHDSGGSGSDSGDSGGDDTGDPVNDGPIGCVDGREDAPEDFPETFGNALGGTYLLVQVDSEHFDELFLMVTFPEDGATAYDEGAPVAVAVPPALDVQARWDSQPQGYFRPQHGIVEVLAVLPGWSIQGRVTSGPPDAGGAQSARAISEAIRFAAGRSTTVEGWKLDQLVSSPVCLGEVALLANSSGGLPAALALETDGAELEPLLAGFAGYENPSLPTFVMVDIGGLWMDPDPSLDADGDGFVWNEGLNPTYSLGACTLDGCGLDWSALTWDGETSAAEALPNAPVGPGEAGLFFLDGNGNGTLDLSEAGDLDLDGDGLLGLHEDFPFVPHLDETGDSPMLTHTPEVVEAADSLGLFSESGWPAALRTLEDTRAFWAERSLADRIATIAALLGEDAVVVQVYTEVPHGISSVARPAELITHQAWLDGGVTARSNVTPEVLACAAPAAAPWAGGEEPGVPLDPATVQQHAIPESVAVADVRAAGVLQVFADAWGMPNLCASE